MSYYILLRPIYVLLNQAVATISNNSFNHFNSNNLYPYSQPSSLSANLPSWMSLFALDTSTPEITLDFH